MNRPIQQFLIYLLFLPIFVGPAEISFAIDQISIAYIPGKKSSFYQSIERGIRQKAKEVNASVVVTEYPQSWDPSIQIDLIHSVFNKQQPHLLIISPSSPYLIQDSLIQLHRQGIRIITIARELILDDRSAGLKDFPLLHISTDNRAGGETMAEELANLIESKGNVYINSTFPDIDSVSQRFKAFLNKMQDFPNINIIGIDIAGIDFSNSDRGVVGSSRELESNAHKQSLEMLQKHPDIKAIFCTNTLSGKGIVRTLAATGLSGSIKIGVWDATEEMVKAIDNGLINLVLAQNPMQIGAAAVFWGRRHLETGERVPRSITVDYALITRKNSTDENMRKLIYR